MIAHVGGLSPLERYDLIDDAFASVLQGTSTAAEFIELARSFADDTDLAVWQRLAGAFSSLDRIVDDDTRVRLQSTVRALAAPALHRMGWTPVDDESDRDRQTRATLFELVGVVGADDDVIARARAMHEAYVDDPNTVDPAMAAAAVNVISDRATREDFEIVPRAVPQVGQPARGDALPVLTRALPRQGVRSRRMLDLCLSEVRTQNAPFVLARALTNRYNGSDAWDFIRRNWADAARAVPVEHDRPDGRRRPHVQRSGRRAGRGRVLRRASAAAGRRRPSRSTSSGLRVNVAFRERERDALSAALD